MDPNLYYIFKYKPQFIKSKHSILTKYILEANSINAVLKETFDYNFFFIVSLFDFYLKAPQNNFNLLSG